MSIIILIAVYAALAFLAAFMVDWCLRRWPRTTSRVMLRGLLPS